MQWKQKTFHELSVEELYAIIRARVSVFVVEQACTYQDLDRYDAKATHLFLQDGEEIAAYARLFPSGAYYKEASIGRVLTSESYRGKGYGHDIMKRAMTWLIEQQGETDIRIQAEYYIKDLYKAYGFVEVSDVFLDDGIEHVYMLLKQR